MKRSNRSRFNTKQILAVVCAIIAVIAFAFFEKNEPVTDSELNGELKMYTIDVGQGDSSLLISPNGSTMLVDAGDSDAFEAIDSLLTELEISDIDVLVATHAHSDHIGSMRNVVEKYSIGLFVIPDVEYSSKTYSKLIDSIDEHGIKTQYAYSGDSINWDDDCTVNILAPVEGASYSESDMNEWSIILRVEYGENAIILTGDAETVSEQISMFSNSEDMFKADVLKVAHHGSSTSSSDAFLDAVDPMFAIISLGEDNKYGHPHKETMQKLSERSITVYRTDEYGTVLTVLTGDTVNISNVD